MLYINIINVLWSRILKSEQQTVEIKPTFLLS